MSKHQVMTPGDYKRYLESKGFKVLSVFEQTAPEPQPRLVANILVEKTQTRSTEPHCTESIFRNEYDFDTELQLKVAPEDAREMGF